MTTTIKHVTLKSLGKNKDIDPSKGTVSNPFTQEEYQTLHQTGTWSGGYVEAMGYVAPPMMDGMGDSWDSGSGSGEITLQGKYSQLSSYTQGLLSNLMGYSGLIYITSTARTPSQQAAVMLHNIQSTSVETQKAIYASPGDQVIDVYNPNESDENNIASMTAKIYEVGPSKVSRHCADPSVMNVFDVSIARLSNVSQFITAIKRVASKVLDEPSNGCVHVEINQPQNN